MIVRSGDLTIDLDRQRVFRGQKELVLMALQWRLLRYLARNQGAFLPAELIFEHVWGEAVDNPRTLRSGIERLRRALGDTARAEKYIMTRRGIGYSLRS